MASNGSDKLPTHLLVLQLVLTVGCAVVAFLLGQALMAPKAPALNTLPRWERTAPPPSTPQPPTAAKPQEPNDAVETAIIAVPPKPKVLPPPDTPADDELPERRLEHLPFPDAQVARDAAGRLLAGNDESPHGDLLSNLIVLGPEGVTPVSEFLLSDAATRERLQTLVAAIEAAPDNERPAAMAPLQELGTAALPALQPLLGDALHFRDGRQPPTVDKDAPPALRELATALLKSARPPEAWGTPQGQLTPAVEFLAHMAPISAEARSALAHYIRLRVMLGQPWGSSLNGDVSAACFGLAAVGHRPDAHLSAVLRSLGDMYARALLAQKGPDNDAAFAMQLSQQVQRSRHGAELAALAGLPQLPVDDWIRRRLATPGSPTVQAAVYTGACALRTNIAATLQETAQSWDPWEARRAAWALGHISGDAAQQTLRQLLTSRDPRMRQIACLVLAPDETLRPQLEARLEDEDVDVGLAALCALAMLPRADDVTVQDPQQLAARLYNLWLTGRQATQSLAERMNEHERRLARSAYESHRDRDLLSAERLLSEMLEAMGSRLSIERDYAGSTLFGKLLEMRLFLDREPPEWLLQRFNWRHYLGNPFHERNALLLARELYAQRRVEGLRGAAVLLSSHFPFVRQRAVEFLRETAGGGFGFRARASLPERTAAVNQWWQWVTEKGAEHLPQMPTRQPPPVPHELF